jgi:UDP-GlcNAc:undecaprenyl-phosphate GlcNAc-1-phosphate transferase
MPTLLLSASSALAVSVLLVPICRLAGIRLGYVCTPRLDRWHQRPTPLFGGVAIAATVLLLAARHAASPEVRVLMVGGAAIFFVGLVDDLIKLKPYSKLIAQIATASMFVFFGYRLGWSTSLTLDALLSLVWMVGLS